LLRCKKLNQEFDFSDDSKVYAIYAPNGVMKTSFAKVFDDYAGGKIESRDAVFSREPYVRSLLDESDSEFSKDKIFIISSFVDTGYSSDNISTLLVRDELRKKYEDALRFLVDIKKPIITELSNATKSSDCEKEIISTFSNLGDNFFDIINALISDLKENKDKHHCYDFKYNNVFDNASVASFLKSNKSNIRIYHEKYLDILQGSDGLFAKDGSFGTVQAAGVTKSVSDNAFFKAGHKFLLNNRTNPIESVSSFKEVIEEAKNKVLSDPELKKQFDKIDSALAPNTLSALREIINDDRDVLLELLDYDEFRRKYWKGHLVLMLDKLEDLQKKYLNERKSIDEIIIEANNESEQWKETLRIFKSRFIDLPFEVDIKNKKDSVLGLKKPELTYTFIDRETGDRKPIEREFLTKSILSNGEKRAFYLLNIIFEIQSRLHSGKETLFLIDDIADSFDYKNKYAIVGYLHDISQTNNFYALILTHNFDFYRTISLRLKVNKKNRLFAQKEIDHIALIKESDACPIDPFKKWKTSLDETQILALIPFVRNLIEYGSNDSCSFLKLTGLLHKKSELKYKCDNKLYSITDIGNYDETNGDFTISNTKDVKYGDIEDIYIQHLGIESFPEGLDKNELVADHVISVANSMDDSNLLENKIVLAIAIRYIAEDYMIKKIDNSTWVNKISGSQTSELFKKFNGKIKSGDIPRLAIDNEVLETLERVNIITPENIHINSFMYEPLVDMSIGELKKLYKDAKSKLF